MDFLSLKWLVCLTGLMGVARSLILRDIDQPAAGLPSAANSVGSYSTENLFSALKGSVSGGDVAAVYDDPGYPTRPPRKLGHFSWKTCGSATDPLQISNLTLAPDPLKLGNPFKVTLSGVLTTQLNSPIEIDVLVQKKVYVWVTLPCLDDLGSCNYPDICARLPPPPCPAPFIAQRLPCTCPIPAGTYDVKELAIEFDTRKFPAWLTEGDFKAHIALKAGGQSIGCYEIELNIVS